MNKSLLILGLSALVMALSGRSLQAQQSAGTRIAIVNVGLVFNKYEKAQAFKKQMEKDLEPFRADGEKLKASYIQYADALKKNGPTLPTKDKEAYEQYLLALKRKMEDLDREVKKLVGKKQEDQIVTMYKELAGAVQAYGQANGIQLVLGFGEQPEGDIYTFPNINRKMQGMDLGCTVPLFASQGMDISLAIVETLNAHYRASAGGGGGGGGGGVNGTSTSLQKKN